MKVISEIQTNNDQYGPDMWVEQSGNFCGFPEITGIGNKAIEEIVKERIKQMINEKANEFDKTNTKNDFIALINSYLGRSTDRCFRNQREQQGFTDNMVKVAALALAALEAHGEFEK